MRKLTPREINRATLDRQMLLARAPVPPTEAIERLVGLQAQQALAPFVGLWTRLADFSREDLVDLVEERKVVKTTFLRGTLHLTTEADYRKLRSTLQPMLTAGWEAIVKKRGDLPDLDPLIAAIAAFLKEEPRSFAEISKLLAVQEPQADVGSMRYGVRTHLPLVQVPTSARWCYPGNPRFILAEEWLGRKISTRADDRTLIRRYLAAFGPATAADVLTWSGLPVTDQMDKARPELQVYEDERGKELLDLPDLDIPDGDVPAPVRFLPEYDNLLLSHQKRTRVLADEHRSRVYLPGLRVASTFLVDGFVAGAWKIEAKRGAATLTLEPFGKLTKAVRKEITDEGEGLVRFIESEAKTHEVRFSD